MKIIPGNDDSQFIDWPVYMAQALALAGNVLSASPNPRVGCLIVADGQVVGRGWHIAAGMDHAEVMALREAGASARGATAFVTLEPCSHHGRTGPCCEALIEAGINRVCIAGLDPNPAVSGNGVAALEQAGVSVYHLPEFEARARELNPGYFSRRQRGIPLVRLKLAMSLDGRTALANGKSKWITSPQARAQVQALRLCSSAIITGVNTVLADDPALTVRVEELDLSEEILQRNQHLLERQPMRVVLDSQLRTPGTARILSTKGQVKIFHQAGSAEFTPSEHVEISRVAGSEHGVDLRSVLESLARDDECNEVLVEAGPALSGAFIAAELVDELLVFIAPKLLGSDAKPLMHLTGIMELSEAKNFIIASTARVGPDIRVDLKKA